MNWKKTRLKNFRLYAITDIKGESPEILRKVRQALEGGADVIQLRSKAITDAAELRLATRILPLCRRFRKLFFINDRVDLVLASGADGVHLGQDDLPYREARKILGRQFFIGRSTHSLAQALKAEQEGHDYIGVGPVFATPTKPTYKPIGLKLVQDVSRRIRIPFVAIGGIDLENVSQVLGAGARHIAVVRAIFGAKEIRHNARKFNEIIEKARG